MKTAVIFASGNGTNFESIVNYFLNREIKFFLVCDKEDAYVFERAKRLGVESYFVKFEDTYNFLKDKFFDLYILAGYMRILPSKVLNLGTFVNLHPSYLPEFKGVDSIKRAYEANRGYSGVSIHYVSEEVDSGEIIIQQKVPITKGMTLETLEAQVHKIEHYLYPRVIDNLLFNSNINLTGEEVLV